MSKENQNLYARFLSQFNARINEEALRTENEVSYSFRDLDRGSARLANFLSSIGVCPGDRVSAQVAKSPETLCLYLACLRGGYVYHPLNTGYKPGELAYFLGNAEPAAVVCAPQDEDAFGELASDAGVNHVLTLDRYGDGTLMEQARDCDDDASVFSCAGDELAALLYSSGTTGTPKGIKLSHRNLASNAESLVGAWGFSERDRLLHALPIFHVHGLFVAIGCALLSGASMRWLASFDAGRAIDYLPECTVMMGVPTYYTRMLMSEGLNADACENIRLFISGSAPLLEDTFTEFVERTGHQIIERYGMTETNMNTSNPLNGLRKPGTVGPPLPGVEVRVVDNQGVELVANEMGNLQVRGPNVFSGYWRLPERTVEDFTDDGFFNTGDLGRIDEDGYVSIVGRAKDLIITGGLNVYPKEVEAFIDELPGVTESAVIGVSHEDFGEAVVAVVVAEPDAALGEAALIDAVKAELANYKVPKRVIFVDELPRNSMAKVQKSRLRDMYKDIFR